MVACVRCVLNITEVRGYTAGKAEYTGLLVEDVQNLIHGLVLVVADELNDRRIDIAGTGTHDQALKRGETHGSIYALTADGSRNGCTVAEMAYDHLCLLRIETAEPDGLLRYECMRCTVEAVTTDAVLLIVLGRDCVVVRLLRKGHTEGSIKYSYVWLARNDLLACLDTHEVCRVVQRAEIEAGTDNVLHVLVYDAGLCDVWTSMEYTVSDGTDLINGLYYTVLCIGECIKYQLYSDAVIRHSGLNNEILLARYLMCELTALDGDTLAETLCKNGLILHIDELILEG